MERREKRGLKYCKKALCVILSVIIAFGTLITLTFGNAALENWLGIKSMMSAYAAEIVDTKGAVAVNESAMTDNNTIIDLEYKDGTNTAYVFSEPITYIDENGNIKAKDISVEKQSDKELKQKGYDYTNGQNDYRIHFSTDSDKGLYIEVGDNRYSIIPLSDKSAVGEESTSLILNERFEDFEYKNIYGDGTNLKFYPQLNGVKDEIVLDQNINKNTFSFEIKAENCSAQLNEDGTVSVVDENGETIQTFSAPYAYDSVYVDGDDNNHRTNCEYALKDNGNHSYTLTVQVAAEWLDHPDTVYPVIIDPTTINVDTFRDAGIYSKKADICYGSEETACIGKSSEYGNGRVYLQFLWPSEIKSYAKINSAFVWMRETTGRTSDMYVQPYMVRYAWKEGTITWNNRAYMDDTSDMPTKNINSQSTDWASSPYWYKMYITSAVQKWTNGERNNYGIGLYTTDEEKSTYNWRAFATIQHSTSSYKPYTVISYTNDETAPTATVKASTTEWTNGNVTLTADSAKDNTGGSGLHATAYSFSTTKGTYNWQASNSKTFSSNSTVYVSVRDAASNIRTYTFSFDNIDKIKPQVTVSGNADNWTDQPVTLSITASDKESGIKDYSFSTVKGSYSWQSETEKTFTENTTVYVSARDNAGNISAEQEIVIDKITSNPSYLLDLEFYEDNHLIGIKNPRENDDEIEYKIGDDGEWIDYITPFAIPIDGEVTVYAKFKDSAKTVSGTFSSKANAYLGNYTDSATDMTVSFVSVSFDIARYYDSADNSWFFSVNSNVTQLDNGLLQLTLPDSSELIFAKHGSNSYMNRQTGYELSALYEDSAFIGYCINMNDTVFKYNADGKLVSVADSFDNAINFEYTDGNLSKISYGKDEVREYIISAEDGVINSITTPLGETLVYAYSNGNLTDVYYDKDTLAVSRDSNIILGHYEYKNDKMSQCNTDSIEYKNGKLAKITNANGAYTSYQISTVSGSEVYGDDAQNTNVYKVTVTSSNDETAVSYFNSALNTIKYVDTENVATTYTFDVYQNLISEVTDDTELTYTYDGIDLVESVADGVTTTYQNGNKISEVSESDTTTYTYDESGNLLTVQTAASQDSENEEKINQLFITYLLTNTYDNGTLKTSKEVTADADGSSREEIVTTYNNDLTVASSVITTTITEDSTSATTIERSAYTYDAFGNVITSQTSSTDKDNTETVSVSNYQYDLLGRNTVITDGEGKVNEEYTYDPLGNVIYQNVNDSQSRSVYDAYSRLIQQIDDEDYKPSSDGLNAEVKTDSYSDLSAGHRYVYAENGNLASETNRLGVTTTYDYYPNSSDVKTESFDIYVFTYDQKGNTTKVTVSGETYADYAYNSEDNPTLVSYGNGQSVRYEYDAHNNLIAQYHNDDMSAYVVYTYKVIENTADSETAENTDTDYSSEFEQDPEVTINTNEEYTLASKVNYDTSRATYYDGDTVTVKSIADDGTETMIYSYSNSETENSRTVTDTYQSGATVTMTTDIDSAVDTFTQSGTGSLATFTSYSSEMDENTNTATSYIKNAEGNTIITSNMTYDDNGNVISEEFILNGSTITYTYTYDDKGRMTSCDYGNGSKSEYAYDANGALIKYNEIYNDNGTKYLYEYDSRGNLNKWIITGLADESGTDADAGITTYETNNQIWLDGITLVDYGEEEYRYTTDYDGSGNPDSYVDYRYDWSSGRNLESVSSTATGTEKLVSRFTYDEKGIRASKISLAGNRNEYLTKDGRITSEYAVNTRGKISSEIVYLYDSNDNLIGFNNQNNTCFYVRNYMGDVMGIVDSDGVWLKKYQYDAWGKMISSRTNDEDFANATTAARKLSGNNMLYRGYYYDTATEMYYLQSRYYSPDQFRFLNPDLPEYAKELKDDYAGTNLFAYCGNDPINRVDYHGYKYDHRKAMQYAERWWNSYNVYKYKTNKDADCANFVSQCLYAGGFAKMDNVWYHRVYSWTDTHSTIPEYRYVVNGAKISLTWGLALELGKWLYRKVGSSNVVMIRKYKNDRYKLDQVGKYLHGKGRCNAVALLRWTDYKGNQHVHIVITGMVVQVYRGKSIYQIYFYGHTNAAGGTSKYSKSLKYFYDRTDIKNQSINIYYIK